MLDWLRNDRWATKQRLHIWGGAIVGVWLIAAFVQGLLNAKAIPSDFLALRAAGEMAADGRAADVYDLLLHHAQTEQFTGARDSNVLPYLYPPHFLFVAVLLGTVNYYASFLLWVGLGSLFYGWVIWRIIPERVALILAFAAPATAFNLQIGQTGFFLAGAAAIAALDHEDHPLRAGLALAVVSVKPQFGVVLGLALIVQRSWRALGYGTVGTLGLVVASGGVFGFERWIEFNDLRSDVFAILEIHRLDQPFQSQSLFSLARGIGVSEAGSWAIHAVFALSVTAIVLATIRRHGLTISTSPMLLIATFVVSPRVFGYDLQILGIAGVMLAALVLDDPPNFFGLWLAIAAALLATSMLSLPGGFVAMLILFFLAVRLGSVRYTEAAQLAAVPAASTR